MKTDPVCGAHLSDSDVSFLSEYEGRKYYFCTSRCKADFDGDPARFAGSSGSTLIRERKIAIVGVGQVGGTSAFALMTSGLPDSIVLIDINRDLAEGQAMDLNHSMPFSQPAAIRAGDFTDCDDADIVVITAGASQKPGESRLDLVNKNVSVFRDIVPKIAERNPRIILVVANPVDVLTYVTLRESGFPTNRVIGSGTILDTARFEYLIGQRCGVDPRSVRAHIIGEHGDSEVPVWSQVSIGGVPLKNYCPVCGNTCTDRDRGAIGEQVRKAAYQIIRKKGATYFAIALGVVRMCASILRDERSVLTLSTLVQDYYDIGGICLSVPVVLGRNGISRIIAIDLDDGERERFLRSGDILKKVVAKLPGERITAPRPS